MSPRPRASRHDETALKCLRAAAQLIDASLDPTGADDPRIRSMRFPASLDWIRIDDVIRTANRRPETSISKKALSNRWETRGDFLQDAVVYALVYADDPAVEQPTPDPLLAAGDSGSVSDVIARVSDQTYQTLLGHPRSFLLCQIAPYFPQHGELAAAVAREADAEHRRWTEVYDQLRLRLGVATRPEWPTDRLALALQCLLDGFVLRHRVEPAAIDDHRWRGASLFADTVLAFVLGTFDPEGSGRTAGQELDARIGARTGG